MNRILLIALLYSPFWTLGQTIAFQYQDTVGVFDGTDSLNKAWAGGLNSTQWSHVELNFDGRMDLIIFDKMGRRYLPFENFDNNGQVAYRYAPEHIPSFPEIRNWAVFRDYNNDGKMDIWAHTNAGIAVYRNESTLAEGLKFTYALNTAQLFTDYGTGIPVNLYVASTDIPGIDDIDGDGDLDVVTFSILGTSAEYHKCMSQELYGHSDSLIYELGDDCWGGFKESFLNNDVFLDTCGNNIAPPGGANRPRHAGSSIAIRDINGNGNMDCVLGDITFNNGNLLTNTGTPDDAFMSAQDPLFPSYDISIDIELFPGFHWVDVDRDGARDMIVSPNADGGAVNLNSVWYYSNIGTEQNPQFEFQQDDFFQDEMIEVGEGAFPKLADLNGDGLRDLLIGNHGTMNSGTISEPRLALWLNTGSESKPEFTLESMDFGGLSGLPFPTSLIPAVGDLDGDGDVDLIVGDGNGNIHYFNNTAGAGNLANFVLSTANLDGIDVGNTAAPELADLDRDGDLDLLIGHSTGKIKYYENTGSASSFQFALMTDTLGGIDMSTPWYFLGYPYPTAIDNGGNWQLFVGGAPGNVSRFTDIENNLAGTFTETDTALVGLYSPARPSPAVADLNNDGYLDAVLGNYSGGVQLYMGIDPADVSLPEPPRKNTLTLYPNPADQSISIDGLSENEVATIEILDLHGRRILSGTYSGTFEVGALSGGYYLLRVQQGALSEVHRLVIRR